MKSDRRVAGRWLGKQFPKGSALVFAAHRIFSVCGLHSRSKVESNKIIIPNILCAGLRYTGQ